MPPRRAVPLTPPSLIPAFLQNVANSCICHTSEKSPVTPIIATLPKTPSRKSFPCHTCDPLPPPSPAAKRQRLTLRAVARLSAPRRVDGPGGSGNKLHADAYRRDCPASGMEPGLAAPRLLCREPDWSDVLA